MRIITVNLNGIRSAARKGFFDWLEGQAADVVCLQETRAQQSDLQDPLYHPKSYHCYYVDALKKGYSGVGIYARRKPEAVIDRLGWPPSDEEGRYCQVDYPGLSVISLYLPSGTSGDHRQQVKYAFLDKLMAHVSTLLQGDREIILCGDMNIAHTKNDIKNWRANQKHSGFLPEERAWLTQLFEEVGYRDAFRLVNQGSDQYTWWSNRGQAYAKNVGWRIDYQIISPGLADQVNAAEIYKTERFSDHAPLIIDYQFEWPSAAPQTIV